MPYANWDPVMSLGIEALDADHQRLLGILNELNDKVAEIQDPAAQKEAGLATLDQLGDYWHVHFAREEAAMAEAGFPDLARHQARHQDFVERIKTFRHLLSSTGGTVTEMHDFLKHWLVEHIMGFDQEFAKFYRDRA